MVGLVFIQHDTGIHEGNKCNGKIGGYDETHPLAQIPEGLLG